MIITRTVVAAAGLLAAPAVQTSLPQTALVAATPMPSAASLASLLTPIGVPVGAPAQVLSEAPDSSLVDLLVARGWIESGPWLLALREGRNAHGRRVLTLDAFDAAAPESGTVGHADFMVQPNGYPAVLEGPFDAPTDPERLPPGASGADLSRWRQYHWFGFAVTPAWQGRGLGGVLLRYTAALASREGASELVIYAAESSREYYVERFEGRIDEGEPFTGADGDTYYRLVVNLRP